MEFFMKPTRNNVIISRNEPELTTSSGIILRDPLNPDRATIEAIGPQVNEVVVGEEVMVDWNKCVEIDKNRYLISEDDIVFIFEK